jgi:peptidoglycan/xylan/chitin deacetylase (PgdA/CDA1 family)
VTRPLTIVMYHYIRDLVRTRHPEIKGLTVEEFRGQLDFLQRHYCFVTQAEVLALLDDPNAELPPNAALLTFDDGYLDHYLNAFPLLHDRGIQGWFFPVVDPVRKGRVLDVNKIHFILASTPSADPLVAAVRATVETYSDHPEVEPYASYREQWAKASRFDPADTIFVKRMLQHVLPEKIRIQLVDELFRVHVTEDEPAFAAELYLNEEHLRMMLRCGQVVGAHGFRHVWMDRLPRDRQTEEVQRSTDFLADLGVSRKDWVMSYPYGAFNADSVDIIRSAGCACALTIRADVADLAVDDRFQLPRVDTNDLPRYGSAPVP